MATIFGILFNSFHYYGQRNADFAGHVDKNTLLVLNDTDGVDVKVVLNTYNRVSNGLVEHGAK